MAAPRSGGFPPLFWIILAGLVVIAAVAFSFYGGRQAVGGGVGTPVSRELGEPPTVRPPDASPGAATVPSTSQAPVEAPPTGGSPLPLSDPDAD